MSQPDSDSLYKLNMYDPSSTVLSKLNVTNQHISFKDKACIQVDNDLFTFDNQPPYKVTKLSDLS